MSDSQPPSLPTYTAPAGPRMASAKEQAPMMKLMGKMLAAKLPKLMAKGKISPQSVKIGHKKTTNKEKKVMYW